MNFKRAITAQVIPYLKEDKILLFIGARQVGKTTVLKQLQLHLEEAGELTHFLNLEDPDYLHHLNESPKNLFQLIPIDKNIKNYVFVDEIQYLDDPSHFLKFFSDEYSEVIQILASGSSAFYLDEKFKDSLAGRKKIFHMRTLSFREFLVFKREDGLAEKDFRSITVSEKELLQAHYQEWFTFGGYPRVVLAEQERKRDELREIAYSYIKKDVLEANVKQEDVFYKLLKILAASTGQLVNVNELARTVGISKTAVDHYLSVMRKSFHIHFIKPFFRNVRKELIKMHKVYFYDLGLRNFLLNQFDPFLVRTDRGALLENIVFLQLLEKYNEEEIQFWRSGNGEVDFILNGKSALEVKSDIQRFNLGKYKSFQVAYPEIPIRCVDYFESVKL